MRGKVAGLEKLRPWTLLGIGALTTIPIALSVFGHEEDAPPPSEG